MVSFHTLLWIVRKCSEFSHLEVNFLSVWWFFFTLWWIVRVWWVFLLCGRFSGTVMSFKTLSSVVSCKLLGFSDLMIKKKIVVHCQGSWWIFRFWGELSVFLCDFQTYNSIFFFNKLSGVTTSFQTLWCFQALWHIVNTYWYVIRICELSGFWWTAVIVRLLASFQPFALIVRLLVDVQAVGELW